MATSALPTVLLIVSGLCVGAKAADSSETVPPDAAKWQGWTELGGYYGSDRTSRGEATVFAPIRQTGKSLFFFEGTGNFFQDDIQEGNFALGYRQMLDSGFNLGGWLGTDVRSTSLDNTFWQLSGGIEALSADYDFRANFYVPLTDPKSGGAGFTQIKLVGNNIFMVGGQEVALGGFDAEAGIRIPLGNFETQLPNMELRAYGGGFYFQDDQALNEIAGGKARVELRFPDIFESMPGSQLTAEYAFSYDDVRKDRHQAGLRLRIPFGGFRNNAEGSGNAYASLNPQERRMVDGLVRDTDIVTTQSGEEGVADALTDVALHRVAYASNEPELQAAVGQGANTLILVQDGGSPIDLTSTSGLALQNSQTIQGGGSTIGLRGANSGTVAGFTAPGGRPTLTSSVVSRRTGILRMASNTHVAGLDINGGYHGIYGRDGLDNMFIEQNRISETRRDGIQFRNNNTNFAVFNNFIDTPGDDGIDIRDGNSGFALFGNTILNAEEDGIFLNHGNSGALIAGNMIIGSADDAIDMRDFNRFVFIGQNTLTGSGENGIQVRDGNRFVLVAENTISDSGNNGIEFDDDNRNILVVGNHVVGTDKDGISFDENNRKIRVAANTVTDVAFDGIYFDHGNRRIFVTGNFVARAGQDGIDFASNNRKVEVIGNTVQDISVDGIFFGSRNRNIIVAHNLVSRVDENGIAFNRRNRNINVSGNTVSDVGDDGIFFRSRNRNIDVLNNIIVGTGVDGISFWNRNENALVAGNSISGTAYDGIYLDHFNSDMRIIGNNFSGIGRDGINIWHDNSNVLLAGNVMTSITRDAFHFEGDNNILLPGSVGNRVLNAPGGLLCGQGVPASFGGILIMTDPGGALRTFTDGC